MSAQAPSPSAPCDCLQQDFSCSQWSKRFWHSNLTCYGDEIFYWLASTQLALGYSDLPFMTALLVRLGSSLTDGSTLAVRSIFLVMGSTVPLLVYWLAYPITGKQAARQSALISLCLPLGGFLGLLAVPDVPLIWFGLIALGAFERALQTDSAVCWILTGLSTACGLSTHYRCLTIHWLHLDFCSFPVDQENISATPCFTSPCLSQRQGWCRSSAST